MLVPDPGLRKDERPGAPLGPVGFEKFATLTGPRSRTPLSLTGSKRDSELRGGDLDESVRKRPLGLIGNRVFSHWVCHWLGMEHGQISLFFAFSMADRRQKMKVTRGSLGHWWVSAPGLVLEPGQLDGPHDLETAWMVHRLYAHLGELS